MAWIEIDPSENRPLFEGQENYALSDAEMAAFVAKLEIFPPERRQEIQDALCGLKKHPFAIKQIRQIINSPQEKFKIRCTAETDERCLLWGADGYNNGRYSVVYSLPLLSNPQRAGRILLHEMLHQRQHDELPRNALVWDMETQAFNRQAELEMGVAPASYEQSFKINSDRWRNIVLGKEPWPEGARRFVPNSDLTSAEYVLARRRFIQQMAAEEMQAQYMQDFVMSRAAMHRGEFSMPVPDYGGLSMHMRYDASNISGDKKDCQLNDISIDYLRARYPFLDTQKIQRFLGELESEYQGNVGSATVATEEIIACGRMTEWDLKMVGVLSRGGVKRSTIAEFSEHSDINCEIEQSGIWKDLEAINDPSERVIGDGRDTIQGADRILVERFIRVMQKKDLSQNAKLFLMSSLVDAHKNIYPKTDTKEGKRRAGLIRIMRQVTGLDGLPIVQSDARLPSILEKSGDRVPTEETALATVPVRAGHTV